MTPVEALPGTPEYNYTSRHTRARNCVERCIGVLKARFRCLNGERKLRYSPEKVGHIINACSVLHNICMKGRLDDVEIVIGIVPGDDHFNLNIRDDNQDFEARRALIQRYFT